MNPMGDLAQLVVILGISLASTSYWAVFASPQDHIVDSFKKGSYIIITLNFVV